MAGLPHDNPMREGWNLEQLVLDAAADGGVRMRTADEFTVGPGVDQTLYIICAPIYVSVALRATMHKPTLCALSPAAVSADAGEPSG